MGWDGMRLQMKKFNIMGVHWKKYILGELSKKRAVWAVYRCKGWVEVDTPMHRM